MLYTDYENLALVYECTDVRISKGTCINPRLKVMTRKRTLDEKFIPLVRKFTERVCLKYEDFVDIVRNKGKYTAWGTLV